MQSKEGLQTDEESGVGFLSYFPTYHPVGSTGDAPLAQSVVGSCNMFAHVYVACLAFTHDRICISKETSSKHYLQVLL